MDKNRFIWMRVGATLQMTEKEYDAIMSGSPDRNGIVKQILERGDFEFEGDTYIPECEMQSCNDAYGTDYETGDMEINL